MSLIIMLIMMALVGCSTRVYYPGSPLKPPNQTIADIYAPYRGELKQSSEANFVKPQADCELTPISAAPPKSAGQ